GQLHGPGALFAGIDFEEAGAVKTARQTIGDAPNGELLVAGAHKGLPHPLPAVVVIDSVDIIISCDEIALEDGFAGARGQIPPTLRSPAVGVLVADRDAHAACGIVAEAEIGGRRLDPSEQHEYSQSQCEKPARACASERPPQTSLINPIPHVRFRFRSFFYSRSATMARKSVTFV